MDTPEAPAALSDEEADYQAEMKLAVEQAIEEYGTGIFDYPTY